jgi:transcriptional regulator with XRE-family HTH domain
MDEKNQGKMPHLLRQERQQRCWSQQQVADAIGTTPLSVGRWERGVTSPSLHFRQALCTLFGKTPQELGFLSLDKKWREGDLSICSETQLIHVVGNKYGENDRAAKSVSYHLLEEAKSPEANVSALSSQSRHNVLRKVYDDWITGVLEPSLQGRALIPLELRMQHDVLGASWHSISQQWESVSQSFPVGKNIEQAYDEAGGALLILGEPGSGKTTLLLELTRILLKRAAEDATYPLPIVFSLNSWCPKRQTFHDWLVTQLGARYQISCGLAQSWVMNGDILPLLDDLDEKPLSMRSQILEMINSYLQEQNRQQLVVCARSADYFEQPSIRG